MLKKSFGGPQNDLNWLMLKPIRAVVEVN